jgi:hypothetical protein
MPSPRPLFHHISRQGGLQKGGAGPDPSAPPPAAPRRTSQRSPTSLSVSGRRQREGATKGAPRSELRGGFTHHVPPAARSPPPRPPLLLPHVTRTLRRLPPPPTALRPHSAPAPALHQHGIPQPVSPGAARAAPGSCRHGAPFVRGHPATHGDLQRAPRAAPHRVRARRLPRRPRCAPTGPRPRTARAAWARSPSRRRAASCAAST